MIKKAIIIDDEPLAQSIVSEFLKDYPEIEVVALCENGFEGAKSIDELHPDLVFLDVQMPKINGFEMLEIIDHHPAVIFTTAHDEFAIKAFEKEAVDYLLKPFSKDRFDQAMQKWEKQGSFQSIDVLTNLESKQPDERLRIVIKDGSAIQIIPTSDVIYLEAYDDYVKIHTHKKTFLKKKTLSYYQKALLSTDFVRIHRSFIINLNELTGIDSYEKNSYRAILKNGTKLPISRNEYGNLKDLLGV